MSGHRPEDIPALLDAWLDGRLDPAARAAFEDRLKADPALREQVELQKQIDQSLRRSLAAPSADRVLGAIRHGGEAGAQGETGTGRMPMPQGEAEPGRTIKLQARPRNAGNLRALALAAALVVAAVGLGWFNGLFDGLMGGSARPVQELTFASIYDQTLGTGFQPNWVCENDEQFAGSIWGRLGQGLLLATTPPNIEMLGLKYANLLTEDSSLLLCYVDRKPVVLLLERISAARDLPEPKDGRLRVFRRDVGQLAVWEITPLAQATVLPLLIDPRRPREFYEEGLRQLGALPAGENGDG